MSKIRLRYVGCNSYKEHLSCVRNSWLTQKEITEAKKLSKLASEDECKAELKRLEKLCQSRKNGWMQSI